MARMRQMQESLNAVATRIESDSTYQFDDAWKDLVTLDSASKAQAFFYVALRLDGQGLPRQ